MTAELKPCPFCGSTELRGHNYVNRVFEACYEIFCLNCDAIIRGYTESDAIAAWNTRREPDELLELIQTVQMRIGELEEQIEENCTYRSSELVNHEIVTLKWVLALRKPEGK